MKRSLSCSIFVIACFLLMSCGTGNRKLNQPVPGTTPPGDTVHVHHDTVNKKVEIRHTGPDQKTIDSIKEEKTRKKK